MKLNSKTKIMSSRTSLQNSPSDFSDSLLKKSIKSERTFNNNDKNDLLNEKRDIVSTSSYKFLSWREKDRRRRFRDEWKHMWLVIPHGNFEVMCLVCHKVMTQRKLDTIKRHTVRRHTEIIDMDQGERILLFDKLFLEHNSMKFQAKNNNNNTLPESMIENGKTDSEVIDLEKLLSSDCVSATSSSSLSPSESRQNNVDLKVFTKRGKYSRKNIKVNAKSNQKIDSLKAFALKTTVESKPTPNKTTFKPNIKGPHIVDNKSFNVWSMANNPERLLPPGNNKTLQDSFFNKFNGSSCLNFLPPMPVMSKCPLCLEDCSQNGTDLNNAFTRVMSHIQQKHSDKFPGSIPSFDLSQFNGPSSNDLVKLQSLLLPPTANNPNYMSISNAISNANFISLLYYQELLRQNGPVNHPTPQYGSVSTDSMYYHPIPISTNSSMFPLFSSPSPQCSLGPPSSIPSGFILPTISEPPRLERLDLISNSFDDSASSFDKFSPFKRAKFSAESLISEANKQSAFYNPKSTRIEEKDVNYNTITKLSSGLTTYSTSTELLNSRFNNNKLIKEESYVTETPRYDINGNNRKLYSDPNLERTLSPKSMAQGNLTCHALRFGPGQDLKAGLIEYIRKKKITAAFIMTCCGSINHAKLRMADSGIPNGSLEIKNYNKNFEIVSMVGSIFENGCHLHISLSDSTGDVIGGHVVGDLIVHTTAEVMVGQICGVRMRQEFDENTGSPELSFASFDNI